MNNFDEKNNRADLFTVAEISRKLFSLLPRLGISANLKGFKYLNDAVCEVYYNPSAGKRIVQGLYRTIAQKNSTTPDCVEHSIRTALGRLERPGNKAKYFEFMGEDAGCTAKKFINAVAGKLRTEGVKEKNKAEI